MDPPSINLVASTTNPNGSADGTTLFTSSYSNRICTFVLPESLLEPRQSPVELTPHSTLALPEPTSAIAPSYLPVASLLWPAPGTHFVAGTANRIALFDVSRPDAALSPEPLLSIPTIPSTRHLAKGGGVGMRGTVSALAAQPASSGGGGGEAGEGGGGGGGGGWGLLAAGTWTRNLGLYDLVRSGERCGRRAGGI
ncbi:hypothetical protein NEMBOFW57_006868 [Staphylotrichum longicolle]|uniref:Uncharacterized protein n=1 Tax=Staphylotrichum longicolle TaxID=669026 RepID=A0AAD4HZY4_9PEZI|nr:hypothetical protein NEMBOFW57_006868 [Staphylotrichum longicolle]